jgi:uncharacterized protein (DUF1330 family)
LKKEDAMRAYYIFHETIQDEETFANYRKQVMPTLEMFGGSFVIRGGNFNVIEGEWPYERTVVLAFPSREKAEAWYASPEYQKVLPLRLASTRCSGILIDGVE